MLVAASAGLSASAGHVMPTPCIVWLLVVAASAGADGDCTHPSLLAKSLHASVGGDGGRTHCTVGCLQWLCLVSDEMLVAAAGQVTCVTHGPQLLSMSALVLQLASSPWLSP